MQIHLVSSSFPFSPSGNVLGTYQRSAQATGFSEIESLFLGFSLQLVVGTERAISLLLCTNGLRNQSSDHAGPPFLALKLFFFLSVRAIIGREQWLLKALLKMGVV